MPSAATQQTTGETHRPWTHPSVLAMAAGMNPIEAITAKSRETVFKAIQVGWLGPPYDPFALAELLKISVQPSQDVVDARTMHVGEGRFRIEFNPNRSRARINFSVAHEIAHTLFPDCAQAIRNRYTHAETKPNDWQLEVLCNIAAAEILMPTGSFKPPEENPVTIDAAIALQRQFSVSSEAVLLRVAKLTHHRCFVFAAHKDVAYNPSQYRIDYAVGSRAWPIKIPTGLHLPVGSVASQCTAIGYTAKSKENWGLDREQWRVECLGIAPYPGHVYPRVVGIVSPLTNGETESTKIEYLKGDATDPRGAGPRIIVQLVNDKAITWGKGFAVAVRKRWPHAQKEFTQWALGKRTEFQLGNLHIAKLEESIEVASLVAQHGYGPSLFPRIDYSALESALVTLASHAKQTHSNLHMPRIGCGEARGDWRIVSEIIDQTLSREDIEVTVYDLPTPAHREGSPMANNVPKN
jgi:O-acetyl-ADP-ribose deacetylase (regulator of RNase III)